MASTIGGKMALLLVLVSMFSVANANKNLTNSKFWLPYCHNSSLPRKIIVGGEEKWRFGFNYTQWALKNGPYHLGDTLVFKFDPPNATTFAHSVYLLRNLWSFEHCDFRWATKIADVNQGGGDGFEFVIRRWRPYYFACGEHNGSHCSNGSMKFPIYPLIPV